MPGRGLRVGLTIFAAASLAAVLILWPRVPMREPPVEMPVAREPAVSELTVHAYPWAEVILDGKPLGFTPRAEPFEVTEGSHILILRNPHHGERSIELEIKADSPETISVNLLENGK